MRRVGITPDFPYHYLYLSLYFSLNLSLPTQHPHALDNACIHTLNPDTLTLPHLISGLECDKLTSSSNLVIRKITSLSDPKPELIGVFCIRRESYYVSHPHDDSVRLREENDRLNPEEARYVFTIFRHPRHGYKGIITVRRTPPPPGAEPPTPPPT